MNEKERYIKIGQDFIDKMTEQQERGECVARLHF